MPAKKADSSALTEERVVFLESESRDLVFFSSGCVVLDCVLGGGFVLGRTANIQGAHSTSKTLLCIEACANFARTFPKGRIYYNEVESAFEVGYAETMGLPSSRVSFPQDINTVEELRDDLMRVSDESSAGEPVLYVVDSLDALVDRAEYELKPGDNTGLASKARAMSELFRRVNRRISRAHVALIIVSQLRDRIGVMFGKKTTRSGGKALNFYASQVLELKHIGTHKRTVTPQGGKSVQRIDGIQVRADCTKNKVGAPFRTCTFDVVFWFGINDLAACIDFLKETGMEARSGYDSKELDALKRRSLRLEPKEYQEVYTRLADATRSTWTDIERAFMPPVNKYRLFEDS